MTQSITLTSSMRSNLSSLKSIQAQMNTTQERLSTGKKVNSAIDNASSFYQARSLNNRAADLDALLDSMGQGVQTIQAANEGIEAVTAYVDQLKSVAQSAYAAKAGDASADISSFKAQYEKIYTEIGKLVADASYQGINLLNGGSLTVTFDENRAHNFVVAGKNIVTEMALEDGTAEGFWGTAAAVTTSITKIGQAVGKLRNYATELGNNFSIIETRQNFTEAMVNVLETGADNLVLADMNEESANYLALQTRQQLAINSLALASQSAQSVLKLF